MFLSIIADYDLPTSICELIDNAVDQWTANDRPQGTYIKLFLNPDRQIITIRDNAGGVPPDQVRLLIAPGASRAESANMFIGNFGVGGKRAGVALGERVVITTRYDDSAAVELAITREWLSSDSWEIEAKRVGNFEIGSTEVKISELRQGFDQTSVESLRDYLEATYSKFIRSGLQIKINGSEIGVTEFDHWAYPPDYLPKISEFQISPDSSELVSVKLSAGLIRDRDPEAENYGVYFYCNERLIVSHLKDREVGFIKGEGGVPHPDASLCRVIVELTGPPELMPWSSNKSTLNYSHPTFLEIRDKVIHFTGYFSTLSRRFKNSRDKDVYPYQTGDPEVVDLPQSGSLKKVVLPPLPRGRKKSYPDRIKEKNAAIIHASPWTLGIVEAMGEVDSVIRKRLETKNRIALILLDSNLEIGLKEFIVHKVEYFRPDKFQDATISNLFGKRHEVINLIKPRIDVLEQDWDKVRHFYELRNKLIHERATVQITDREIADYRAIVESILNKLFELQFDV